MAKKLKRYINRELSWLDFNQRVLDEAAIHSNPLLERLKFLAISASNLDEFFMVRVGGLQLMRTAGKRTADPSGMTPATQLKAIAERSHRMVETQSACYTDDIEPALAKAGIARIAPQNLTDEQRAHVRHYFLTELFPVCTPIALRNNRPFPLLRNLELNLAVRLAPANGEEDERYAVIPLGQSVSRFVVVPSEHQYCFVLLEDVACMFAQFWFPGIDLREAIPFRVTRNADISVQEDEAADLLLGMESILEARKTSDCVRLEVDAAVSSSLLSFLTQALNTKKQEVYQINGPLNLKDFFAIALQSGFTSLKFDPWIPQLSPQVDLHESLFDQIAEQDILLYHPYDSFSPVVRFIEEAADDPDVLAIKQVLYRTSSDSPIIQALKRAAENGKYVTALVELKARFDEARNIEWARLLEQAGVQVIYGVHGLKTHAKVCLVVRREATGIRRYVHYGTGNYNDATAKIYADVGFITGNEDYGADASIFFNAVCGYSQPEHFHRIFMAPLHIRDKLIDMIDSEIERRRQGHKARIILKVNSLVDIALIDKLYEASQAGVKVNLNVRGICCLRPGVPKLSENITNISIIDRYLEHARVFYFYQGGGEKVFISSADWMPRNLDRRVELMIPVEDTFCRNTLIKHLKIHLRDTEKSWTLQKDGTYVRTAKISAQKKFRSQAELYRQACASVQSAKKAARTLLQPHRPIRRKK